MGQNSKEKEKTGHGHLKNYNKSLFEGQKEPYNEITKVYFPSDLSVHQETVVKD